MDITADKLTTWEQGYRSLYPDPKDAVASEENLVEAILQSNLGEGARSAAKAIAAICETEEQGASVIASMMAVGIRVGIALAQSEVLELFTQRGVTK